MRWRFQPLRPSDTSPIFCCAKHRGGVLKYLSDSETWILAVLRADFLIFQNIGRRGFFFFCGLVFLCGEQELFNLLPCVSVGKYRGETEGTAVSEERGWKRSFICSFFSTARRTNQEAPPQLSGLLACRYGRRRGGCGTRSAQTVLVLFPPSPLRLRRPIKAESGIVTVAVFFNPSVTACHLPYILRCKTQGRSFKISPIKW